MKNAKKLITTIFVAILSLLLVPTTTIYANHQGSQPIYGHFGQPHGYVISGDFTFIVQVHGKVDRVTYKIVKANDINNVLGTYNQTSVSNGSGGDSYYNLVWNSTGFEDGQYKLFADVESDSATANGWRDFVVHYNGTNHLEFSVNNPKVEVPPISQPAEDSCTDKITKANSLSEKVYDKHKNNFTYIDNFLQQSTVFAKEHSDKNYEEKLKTISETRKTSSDLLVELEKIKTFSCDGSLEEQIDNFVTKSTETRDSLDSYKDSVIDFILIVIGDV